MERFHPPIAPETSGQATLLSILPPQTHVAGFLVAFLLIGRYPEGQRLIFRRYLRLKITEAGGNK
ncbi:MAG: hypothetical protein JXQ81_08110 [Desulfuromonadales bacterium]|nr:hypothetical protein [Desulfuromonadales bacterium]MBN2792453.1 hypothetical protein [Desulfuromonadales bacterium]